MRHVFMLAFIFLAVWLLLTGLIGLAGIALSPILSVIMNLLALAAGIMLLVSAGKCHCSCDKCRDDHITKV